jgi:hypothetical protein
MQRANFQAAVITQFQTQATRVLPGHGTGIEEQAINDDSYIDDHSPLRLAFSVLANVVGGTLLFFGMLMLPHIVMSLF